MFGFLLFPHPKPVFFISRFLKVANLKKLIFKSFFFSKTARNNKILVFKSQMNNSQWNYKRKSLPNVENNLFFPLLFCCLLGTFFKAKIQRPHPNQSIWLPFESFQLLWQSDMAHKLAIPKRYLFFQKNSIIFYCNK